MGEHGVRVYQDSQGEWRWTRTAGNNEVIADSGEGYEHQVDCLDSMLAVNRQPYVLTIIGGDGEDDAVFHMTGGASL